MINLTVKTLDSRNHQFSVEDDITVEQFKRHIADTVDISAETQRIIYCGRVLQDASKLNDYDVDGKVVHLVQRPPPSLNNAPQSSNNTGSTTNQENQRSHRRLFQTLDHGNAMFLGSVAIPTNFIDAQGVRLSPHHHIGSRLSVARRMLVMAEHTISLLENPNRPQQTPPEEPQEEVSSVIEATVIVPRNSAEPFDEAAIFSAVDNFRSAQIRSAPSTSATDQSTSGNSSNPPGETTEGLPSNATRITRMAEVLSMLSQLQTRFAPFLQRYHTFLQDDPVVAPEDVQAIQTEMNRISEVLHFFGHAYHSLSDMIVRVQTPPPRPLLCHNVIQHSAVVRTGIPIQVEAQINLTGDRNGRSGATTTTTSQPTAASTVRVPLVRNEVNLGGTTSSQGNAANVSTASGTATAATAASSTSTNNHEVEFVMEVGPENITLDSMGDANHAEDLLRGSINGQPAPPSLIQSIMQMAGQLINQRVDVQPTFAASTPQAPRASQARSNQTRSSGPIPTARPHVHLQQQTIQGGFDTYLPCNSHHLRRRPPFSNDGPNNDRNQQQSATQNENNGDQQRQRETAAAQETTAQYNSIVSHSLMNTIVSSLRNAYQRQRQTGTGGSTNVGASATTETTSNTSTGIGSQGNGRNSTSTTIPAENTPSAPPAEDGSPQIASFFLGNMTDMLRGGPTLAEIMQQLPPDTSYVPGDSIITDFIMMISNNLRIGDIIMLNGGNIEPLTRMVGDIQNFFVDNVMDGSRNESVIDASVERLLTEMQPFFDTLGQIPIRDDIDIEASVRRLLRMNLPSIFRLSSRISDEPNNLRTLVDQFVRTVKELFAVVLRASVDGIRGVDRIFDVVATRYMEGIPAGLQQWTLITGRSHFRQLVSNLEIPTETISSYLVHRTSPSEILPAAAAVSATTATTIVQQPSSLGQEPETMEVEEVKLESDASLGSSRVLEDMESLPDVVIGSEPWHSQVPEDWVPIITRDNQRQKHQQPPFSDAYLSGMPSKRRKLVHASKGRQNLPLSQVIAENMRRAVTATGLASAAPLETVARAAGSSEDIQSAYRGLLRTSVQEGLRNNQDFTPERFPNATSYFSER